MRNFLFLLSIVCLISSCSSSSANKSDDRTNEHENSGVNSFRWDFDSERKFVYSYAQKVQVKQKNWRDSEMDEMFSNAAGNLNIRSKGGELADLSITNMEMSIIEAGRDTMKQSPPDIVVQDMAPDGSMKSADSETLFNMLLPLPSEQLSIGESTDIAMEVPISANGSVLYAKGQNRLTYARDEKVNGRLCAVIEGVIDVSKLDVPEEMPGEYKCSTKGSATYYFDKKEGCYVKALVSTEMIGFIDQGDSSEYAVFMDMSNTSEYEIELLEIE
jgi:hypothetical protein